MVSLMLALVGAFVVGSNGWIFWRTIVKHLPAPSVVPVLGGLFAAAGVALFPASETWRWAWVPLVIDWGGAPGLVVAWLQGAFK